MPTTSGAETLGQNINKVDFDSANDQVSVLLPELTLDMSDEDLIVLKNKWLKNWEEYGSKIKTKQDEIENYYLGNQFTIEGNEKRKLVDNLLFESLETFLPMATRQKADPMVESDNSEEGNALADKVRKMLIYITDILSFNLKLKKVARNWSLYYLGVMKVGWSQKNNEITCRVILPQKLVFDPKATIEEGEYTGKYIGEYMGDDIASDLVIRFPKSAEFIRDKVKGNMGTSIPYIQWSTDEYIFWTIDDHVLGKIKNPHWNYDSTESSAVIDEYGNERMEEKNVPGRNLFNAPKMPYIFLSIFNLGKSPYDDTSLLEQNLPLQDLVNKRLAQINHNADNANGSIAVSGDAFTEEQAQNISRTRRKGGTLWIPTGPVQNAVQDLPATPLPNFVYESLVDYRNELRNVFGVRGSTPQGTIKEQTLGGKQIIKSQDTDRIGGGISTYLEQFSDNVFNWFVQLMYVYYDEAHTATVIGAERTKEYIQLINSDFGDLKLLVGVKEGSMIPQDPVNKRAEAVELWSQKAIDPITFFERLEFPNPRESAKNLYLWNADPIKLFPDLEQEQLQQQMMQQQQQQQEESQNMMMQQEQEDQSRSVEHENELQRIALQNAMKQ